MSWTVTNADSIQIEPSLGGVITANASRNVSPNTTTTYTLTARCSNNTETRTVRVNVDDVGAGVRPDPAAPTAPSGFTASGFGTTVTFNWTDNSNNETGFKIYQDGVTNPVLSPGAHSGTGPQSAQLTGIGCNFSGKFYIVAVNAAGPSSNSPMPTAVTIPCAPTTFIATGERTTIHFRWNDTPNETGFQVYQQGTSATKVGPRLPSNTNNYDFDALFCNGEGTYFVRAVNGAGESADSPVDHAVTVPCPPTITGASAISATAVRVDYTDTSTIENGFHIYRTGRDEILKTTIPLPASGRAGVGFPDGLPCGQKYSYYVKAFNDAGESAASATTNGTTSACTVAVTFSTIKVLDDRQPFTGAQITCDLNAIYGDFHRWPNSGYITINSGETKPISVTIVKNLLRTEDLGVVVRCHENATFQLHPYMGEVAGDYEGSANWSAGTYCPIKSKSNGTVGTAEKLFEICYTIKVTP
ncbi:MAG: hypothetical protein HY327_13845 [Chloroflexi bacterium]|nr:hypothetical protein [Chloroflexota bacterium]